MECNESHLDFCWRSIKKVGGCTIKGCLGTNYGSEYTFESPTNAALSFEQLEAPIILNGTCCSLSVGEIDESSFQCSLFPANQLKCSLSSPPTLFSEEKNRRVLCFPLPDLPIQTQTLLKMLLSLK